MLSVNGKPLNMDFAAGDTAADVVSRAGCQWPPLGVWLDGEFVPRASWPVVRVPAGARLEIIDVRGFPSPIAICYHNALEQSEPYMRYRMLMQSFAAALRLSSHIVLADYLAQRDSGGVDAAADQLFVQDFARPSLGKWNEFLRTILKALAPRCQWMFVPELLDFYFGSSTGKPQAVRAIDELLEIRNQYDHFGVVPSALETKRVERLLNILLSSLSFLTQVTLVRRWSVDGVDESCTGLAPERRSSAAQIVNLVLKRAGDNGESVLPMGFFLYAGSETHDSEHPALLYETTRGNRVVYVSGNDQLFLRSRKGSTTVDPLSAIRDAINAIAASLPFQPHPDIRSGAGSGELKITRGILRQLATHSAELAYGEIIRDERFSPDSYVERQRINLEFERFMGGDRVCMIIVAESGLGKTNLLCRWRNRQMSLGPVFLMQGRNYDGSPFHEYVLAQLRASNLLFGETFKGGFEELLRVSSEGDDPTGVPPLTILLDGINEAPDPEEAFRQMFLFATDAAHHPMKVVVTLRPMLWQQVNGRFKFDPHVFYAAEGEEEAGDRCVLLESYSPQELKLAYEKCREKFSLEPPFEGLSTQARRLLQNPLMLRMVGMSYQDSVLPPNVFSEKVFATFSEGRIHERDHTLLDNLTEAMWILKRDYVLLQDFDGTAEASTEAAVQEGGRSPESLANHDALRRSLRQHVYVEPPPTELIGECRYVACPRYGVMTAHTADHGDAIGHCEGCGRSLQPVRRDMRPPFTRLEDEKILVEFDSSEDRAIRFTHDRWFEYLLGNYLAAHVIGDQARVTAAGFCKALERVSRVHAFAGAFKNVLLNELRRERSHEEFWVPFVFECLTYSEDGPGGAVSLRTTARFRQVFLLAIREYATETIETPAKVALLLSALIDETRPEALALLSLQCAQQVALSAERLDRDSPVIALIRAGMRDSRPRVRQLATQTAYYLSSTDHSIALQLMAELKREVAPLLRLPGLVKLAMPSVLTAAKIRIEGLAIMSLYLLGSRFSEADVQDQVMAGALDMVRNNALAPLLTRPVGAVLGRRLAQAYWSKPPYACNFIEIHLTLNDAHRPMVERISQWFRRDDHAPDDLDELWELCQVENGFISWCLYSLIPIAVQESPRRAELLAFLERLFDEGNHVAQYISMSSLSILAHLSNVEPERVDTLFRRVVEQSFDLHGSQIMFRHRCPLDATIRAFLDESKDGRRVRPWAQYVDGQLCLSYDNPGWFGYADYLVKRRLVHELDFVERALESRTEEQRRALMPFLLRLLGDIGVDKPDPALRTMWQLIHKYMHADRPAFQDGIETTQGALVAKVLSRIKCHHPIKVEDFIDGFTRSDLIAVSQAITPDDEPEGWNDSYYGELVFQKSFLNVPAMRHVWGSSMAKGASASTVEAFFRSYIDEFWKWICRA